MDTFTAGVDVDAVEYDMESVTFRTQFDQEKTSASMAVLATLAEAMDADMLELEPLYSTVDPEALDAVVRLRKGTDGDIQVTFTHEDHAITVYSYGVVTVTPEHEPAIERDTGK